MNELMNVLKTSVSFLLSKSYIFGSQAFREKSN
jgi:hypothetical protein